MATNSSSITFFNSIITFPFFLLLLSLLSTFPTKSDCARPSRAVRSAELHFMRKLFRQFERKSGTDDEDGGIGTFSSRGAVGYAPTIEMKKCAVVGKSSKAKGKANLLGWGMKFALKKLEPGERYLRAELHLYTRGHLGTELVEFSGPLFGQKNNSLRSDGAHELIRVMQFVCDGSSAMVRPWPDRKIHIEVAKLREDALGHTMLSGQQGWSTFDAMTLLMYAQMDELGELYINFLRNGKPLDEVYLRRFIRNHRPFLVVYTSADANAKKANGMDKFNKFGREKREVRATVQNYANHEDVRRQMEAVRETAEYYSYGMAKSSNAMMEGEGEGLPRNAMDSDTFGKLKRRRKMKIRKSRKSIGQRYPGFDPNDPMLGFGTPYSPWQREPYQGTQTRTLQSPNSGKSLNDIRALREHTYREVNKPSGKEAKSDENFGQEAETKVILLEKPNHSKSADERSEKKCSLHNMTVDFREIGWSDRIIAPKSFEAGFCAGHCDYPLDQESNPTNHAILQSLIATHRLQQNARADGTVPLPAAVPATVCCAPDRFDSLTLLYFDEHDNVVLKNYPKMVALSCGCL